MDQIRDRTLRAKYLDWCSARLAERFLDLSPEAIYALARPEGVEPEPGEGSDATLPDPTDASYRQLVQRVTESLIQRTPLPTYEQWAAAYEEAPGRFDGELLGLWKEVTREPAAEESSRS
jgi:hypothetical protein